MSDNTLYLNSTQIPNVILDEWLPHLTGSELRVVLYICRRTYGFQKNEDAISLKQMADGITKRDGTKLDLGAGLSKSAAAEACKSLETKRVLKRSQRRSEKRGDEATAYSLNLDRVPRGGVQKSDTGCPETGRGGVQKSDTQNKEGQEKESSPPKTPPKTGGRREKTVRAEEEPDHAEAFAEFVATDPLGPKVSRVFKLAAAETKSKRKRWSTAITGYVEEIRRWRESGLSDEAIEYGLDETIRRSKGGMAYAKQCAKGYEPESKAEQSGRAEDGNAYSIRDYLESKKRRAS